MKRDHTVRSFPGRMRGVTCCGPLCVSRVSWILRRGVDGCPMNQQVAARANGADVKTHSAHATAKAKHMDIKCVTPRGTTGPSRFGQLGAMDHGPESLHHRRHDAGFHRGQRHPPVTEADHSVIVDTRNHRGQRACPFAQRGRSTGQLIGVNGTSHPVLEDIVTRWGRHPWCDDQQAGNPRVRQLPASFVTSWPLNELHGGAWFRNLCLGRRLHGAEGRKQVFPAGFTAMNSPACS
jgi:hypothetical protein